MTKMTMLQKYTLVSLFTFFTASFTLFGQGIEFHHGTWAEAVEMAKESGKPLFVDGYAVWCGPCKRLSKSVFPTKEAGDFFNANFINVKMDMEKGEGKKFRQKYPLSAYPTLFFIQPDGKLINAQKGAPRTAAALIEIAKKSLLEYDRSADYKKAYDEGARDYTTMYNLVKSLNASGKSSLTYSNEYLRSQSDITTEENLKFLHESLTQLDTRLFDNYLENYSAIKQLFSEEKLQEKHQKAAWRTVQSAMTHGSTGLLEEAQNKYKQLQPAAASDFEIKSNLRFAEKTRNGDAFISAAQSAWKSGVLDQKEKTSILKTISSSFANDMNVLKKGEKLAASFAKEIPTADHLYMLAKIQSQSGKSKKAIDTLNKCIKIGKANEKNTSRYEKLLSELKAA